MKMAIKYVWPFRLFRIKDQRIGTLLGIQLHLKSKLSKYENSKSCSPLFIFFNEKIIEKNLVTLTQKYDFESQNFAVFDL